MKISANTHFRSMLVVFWAGLALAACSSTPPAQQGGQQGTPGPQNPMPSPSSGMPSPPSSGLPSPPSSGLPSPPSSGLPEPSSGSPPPGGSQGSQQAGGQMPPGGPQGPQGTESGQQGDQQQAGGSQGQGADQQQAGGSQGQGADQQQAGGPRGQGGDQQQGGGAEQTAQAGQPDGTGEWPEGAQAGTGQTGSGGDDEFERSLEDFDQIMGSEQEAMARTGVGTAADEIFRETAEVGGSPEVPVGEGGGSDSGERQRGDDSLQSAEDTDEEATATVEGCNDEDKVARQLCEAATEEEDPFLRAALWDEYNEYKKILARQ